MAGGLRAVDHPPRAIRRFSVRARQAAGRHQDPADDRPGLGHPVALQLDQQPCRHLEPAIQREWLVTNGLGGYASGTVAGVNTRRYHGLLIASRNPPVQRMVLLAALEEWLIAPNGERHPLSAQEYWDGTVYPDGFRFLEGVDVDGTLATFRWGVNIRIIKKRIWMEHRLSRTVVTSWLVSGPPVSLQL